MRQKNIHQFLIRFTFIFFVQLILKGFDTSFGNIFEFTIRGLSFSIVFISYWLIIWYTASFLNTQLFSREKELFKKKPRQILIIFLINFLFAFLAGFIANYLYRSGDVYIFNLGSYWSNISLLNPEFTVSLLAIYLMVFSFDIYLQSILDKKEDQIKLEKLKQENTLAKYLNLKSQIEPHFLFNSLSVLSSIIYTNVDLASDFVLRLSKILRYVIEKNELLLVPLKDEITFINDYFFLIQTRFEKGIVIENNIDENNITRCSIPPVSLQLLVENAIKHNKFTNDHPLRITLYNDTNFIVVKNNINIRNDITANTKQGLENLTKRYSFLSDKAVKIEITENEFIVSLPILSNIDNESFNI
ncbi:MAG: histidine kinase [Bacteroidales bacterium]|nr:histidine kinase [Bacteroidales bacterium]